MDEPVRNNLVILHGYGAGIGFWYKNYDALSNVPGWELYSLDLLGMGRSSRPPFRLTGKSETDRVTQAEDWLIDALEEWRIAKNLESFTLLAHSLGGYLAVSYALKYPGHIRKLILVSPVGMLGDSYSTTELPEKIFNRSQVIEQSPPIQHTTIYPRLTRSGKTCSSVQVHAVPVPAEQPVRLQYPRCLIPLWSVPLSPFTALQYTGPLGPKFLSCWSSRTFYQLPANEAQALHDYCYSIYMLPTSSDLALSHILTSGLFGRNPLLRRVHRLGRQYFQSCGTITRRMAYTDQSSNSPLKSKTPSKWKKEKPYSIILFYGENDWMDKEGGYMAQQKVLSMKEELLTNASEEEKSADEGDAKVIIVPKAGHIVHLDGWEYFNSKVIEEMEKLSNRIRT